LAIRRAQELVDDMAPELPSDLELQVIDDFVDERRPGTRAPQLEHPVRVCAFLRELEYAMCFCHREKSSADLSGNAQVANDAYAASPTADLT
jgi:hypothetical protein